MLFILHRVHETPLDAVEHQESEEEDDCHKDKTVDEPAPAHKFSAAEESVFEGLDDGGDGIEAHQLVDGDAVPDHAPGLAEGVDDRGRIHPELHKEGQEDLEVAVFGGHRGEDDAETQREARHHHQKHREKEGVGVEVGVAVAEQGVAEIDDDKES